MLFAVGLLTVLSVVLMEKELVKVVVHGLREEPELRGSYPRPYDAAVLS